MIASVHVADVGARSALAIQRKRPLLDAVKGLRHAHVALAAPLGASVLPSPDLGRVGLIAFWEDDDALDRFLTDHPLAHQLAKGWRVRLEPLRAAGTWPGLPEDVPRTRAVDHDGPAAVLTLGRLRLTQAVRFLRASAKAEARAIESPGLMWGTGLARPPFVATCSLWQTTRALSTYAYGHRERAAGERAEKNGRSRCGAASAHWCSVGSPQRECGSTRGTRTNEQAHPAAITADEAKPFHHQSAFIRFRPYGSKGCLEGRNPLPEALLAAEASPSPS